ncbi:MAG: LLM class flavin-dependent oxidoreductase [Deltaproteobacteria bacterium]|jgi:alkanesulfonate monooxygenase SsuD/methylene tetrahydromethanopterin reductase-like flavin-dependent oxidoreductase (luciferase family)|nr:LLM class flavin-dependent oxidoreductase [Deltaproteobacteria bacterium]
MKIGMCLPYMEREFSRADILAWCRAIDGGGFSTLACGERVTGHTYDMRVLLSAAAAVTERVTIMPTLYVLPMHSAARVAKEMATLDVLTEGRSALAVGVGGREMDYRALGASFERRHERLDEQVAELKRLWAGGRPFEGADELGPAPIQAGGPPIFAGAMGPKAIRRAAAWAEGLYSWSGNGEAAEIEGQLALARAAWQEAGREEAPRRLVGFWLSLADDASARLQRYVYEYLRVFGEAPARAAAKTMTRSTPAAVGEALDAMEALGAEECLLVPATADLSEVDRAAEIIASR